MPLTLFQQVDLTQLAKVVMDAKIVTQPQVLVLAVRLVLRLM